MTGHRREQEGLDLISQDVDEGHDDPGRAGLFDGDLGDASASARTVITYLIRNRVLLGRDDPELWAALVSHEGEVVRHFHNMFVDLLINRDVQVAFKQQVVPDRVPFSVIVRAATLTREASVLALYAVERLNHAPAGESVVITRAEARGQMEPYWPAQVSNRAAKDKAVNGALDNLTRQDLLIKLGDDEWEISPAVPLVFTAGAIARFTDLLTAPEPGERQDGPVVVAPAPDEGGVA